MHISPVDPRDVDAEVTMPVYRVYFAETETRVDEIRITGARDVFEVVDWAERDARGVPFTVYCEHPSPFNPGKVTLQLLLSR
ncbi:hypothetical protein EDF54_0320 [Rathayibacter sp. PhB93]|nr:hypothetical protein EDF54_0320 [Rathayibacter sp. PhB93]TDQ15395.1 hypothetical protein EDF17_0065 [Rathayibacter sp. PhB1]